MTDLTDFTRQRPPVLHLDTTVRLRVPGRGQITAGKRGPVPARRAYGFLQWRERERHHLHELDAYAMSESVLQRVRKLGCSVILFAETETKTVYEFHERQFDEELPKRYNPNADQDEQLYVPLEEARGVYEDHTESVLLRGTEL